jgi:hypothetical protein
MKITKFFTLLFIVAFLSACDEGEDGSTEKQADESQESDAERGQQSKGESDADADADDEESDDEESDIDISNVESCTPGKPKIDGSLFVGVEVKSGIAVSSTDLEFDAADISVRHRKGEGCVTQVKLSLTIGDGCELLVVTDESFEKDGVFRIKKIELSADTFGKFIAQGGIEGASLEIGNGKVVGPSEKSSCLQTSFELSLDGELEHETEPYILSIMDSSIEIKGEFSSEGDQKLPCPDILTCLPDCEDRVCGDDGCGGKCGKCSGDQKCNDRGLCCDCTVFDETKCEGLILSRCDGCNWNSTNCREVMSTGGCVFPQCIFNEDMQQHVCNCTTIFNL